MARTTGTERPTAASMREVGKPAAIEIRSASRPRAGRISPSTDSRIWGFTARMTICACRAASSFFSLTSMPSSEDSASPFARLGCEAIRFSFVPTPNRGCRAGAPSPCSPPRSQRFSWLPFSPLSPAPPPRSTDHIPSSVRQITVARCTRSGRGRRVPRPLRAACRTAGTRRGGVGIGHLGPCFAPIIHNRKNEGRIQRRLTERVRVNGRRARSRGPSAPSRRHGPAG